MGAIAPAPAPTQAHTPARSPAPDLRRVPRILLPLFVFAHFAHHVGTGGLAPLLPLLRDSFDLDYARSGLLLSAQGVALGLGQLPISALGDRLSKRAMIACGLIGVGVMGVGISLTTSFWQLVPLLALTGFLAATYHAPAAAYLAEVYAATNRGRALGVHVIGGSLAFALTPVIALLVVQLTGSWRMAFLALAVPPLLAGVLMLLVAWQGRHRTAPHGAGAGAVHAGQQVRALAALRSIGPLVGIALAEQLLTASMFAFIPLFMVDQHGVPEDRAGLTIALIAGVGIVAAPLGGALSDRFGRAPVLVAVTASVGPLILLLTYAPYGWPLFLVLVLYGLSMNTRLPVLESLFADAIPAARRATVLGMYYFVGQESASLTMPIVGSLIDATSLVATFTLLGLTGCVLSLGLFFFRRQLVAPRPAGT
ncbi:MAG TPA: MFS transporter [Chloroflexota bacterium]|nr:MFS transporter [Chloroflexota bacterium]